MGALLWLIAIVLAATAFGMLMHWVFTHLLVVLAIVVAVTALYWVHAWLRELYKDWDHRRRLKEEYRRKLRAELSRDLRIRKELREAYEQTMRQIDDIVSS